MTEESTAAGTKPKPEPDDDAKKMTPLDRARWICAFIVGAFALLLVSRSYVDPAAKVCRQEVGEGAEAVTLCGPIGLEDALWVGLVGLVGILLLLKDFSEVSVTGIGSLKRTVEETKKKTEEQEKKTAELERFIVAQLLNLSVTNTLTQNQTFILTPEGIRRAAEHASKGDAALRPRDEATPTRSREGAELQTRILELWEGMATVFATVTGDARRGRSMPDPEGRVLIDHPRLLAWYRDFKQPFNTFRAVRNAVAHPPHELSDDDLRNAVALGESLMTSLDEAVVDEN